MTLIRWAPAATTRDLGTVQNEVNRLFDDLFGRPQQHGGSGTWSPAVDIEETPEAFVFRLDLPGLSQKDIKVSLAGDTLTIRGERRREGEKREGNLRRLERVHGAFERSFTLHAPVKAAGIQAAYRDGVLEVTVPKAEDARVREIEVQVG